MNANLTPKNPSSNTPNIRTILDEKKLFETAAKILAQQLALAIKKKGHAVLAFAGGRSAAALCAHLKHQPVDWSNVHIFMIDERLVPITDEQSNFKILNDNLVSQLVKQDKLPRSNIHPFVHEPQLDDEGTRHYADELESVGSFDVIFVSAGEDGHCAGLYPKHPLMKNETDLFAAFHDSPKPPADRMTALPRNFVQAGFSLLLVVGDSKREALTKLQSRTAKIIDCPSKLVTTSADHLVLTNLSRRA